MCSGPILRKMNIDNNKKFSGTGLQNRLKLCDSDATSSAQGPSARAAHPLNFELAVLPNSK